MNRPYSRRGYPEQPYTDRPRYPDQSTAPRPSPFYEPGLVPGSYQYDPDHHGSHGGYWERRDTRSRPDERGFFDKAADEVQSWFGDEDAERRRERDHRGKGPRNYQRSDERIAEDVNQRLADDHHLDASDIEVSVSGQEVTLNGKVESRAAKRHAEDCADTISGVVHVQNNLRVRKPTEPTETTRI